MRAAYDVASVRAAEAAAMADLPDGTLMQRAAFGLAVECARILREASIGVSGSRVVLAVGSGNNGGDALYAGAYLARRGASVTALLVAESAHDGGCAALRAAGGRIHSEGVPQDALLERADLVIDGIVGIGSTGPLRGRAREIVHALHGSGVIVVAVDVPSGVDPDTGLMADIDACVFADHTVTFGCEKPAHLVYPGREACGDVTLVDIDLADYLATFDVGALEAQDVATCVPEPEGSDYKYSRGVVGVVAGSGRFPGAALLTVGAARFGGVGKVHLHERGETVTQSVISHFPDVTADTSEIELSRITAWALGPGMGTDDSSARVVSDLVDGDAPLVLDADALRLVAGDAGLRDQVVERGRRGFPCILTPHAGEFRALGFDSAHPGGVLAAARAAARELCAIVVLKGPGTVIAAPDGTAYVDLVGGAELGTAGSGDVLTGLIGSMLASAAARGELLDIAEATRCVAAAVYLHGAAGHVAAEGGRPVTAGDLVEALPQAIAEVRRVMEWEM